MLSEQARRQSVYLVVSQFRLEGAFRRLQSVQYFALKMHEIARYGNARRPKVQGIARYGNAAARKRCHTLRPLASRL